VGSNYSVGEELAKKERKRRVCIDREGERGE